MGKHITKRHPRSCWSTEKAVTCSCEGEKHYFEHLLNENRLFSEPPTATEENICFTSFLSHLRNFIQLGPPSAEKKTSCRFSGWGISAIFYFRGPIMGSLKSPCRTFYRSSIETIALNCLVFEKIAFLHFGDRLTDRQTNKQMDTIDALSCSRCGERRLNK